MCSNCNSEKQIAKQYKSGLIVICNRQSDLNPSPVQYLEIGFIETVQLRQTSLQQAAKNTVIWS